MGARGWRCHMDDGLQTLYSMNGIDWCLLDDCSEAESRQALKISHRFVGDPSFTYEVIEMEQGEEQKNVEECRILEETRLSAVVAEISKKAFVQPVDSVKKDGSRNVQWNGLARDQAYDLSNWRDSLDNPISKNSNQQWSVQTQKGAGVDREDIVLRNLLWMGAMSYHTPNTNQFAKIYVGHGQKRMDFVFMV